MNKLVRCAAALVLVSFLAPSTFADEALDALEKKLIEKWSKTESVSAKISMNTEMDMGGAKMTSKGEGSMEFQRKGDKQLMRMELATEMVMPGQTMASTSVTINDGEYNYTVSEMMGQKSAMKSKSDHAQGSPVDDKMFETLKKDNTVTVLPDEKVGGQDAHVIHAVPKAADQPGANTMKMYFAKDTGVMLQMLGIDQAGKTVMTFSYSDVKVNGKIDPARFVFEAPPGVTVMEMPGMP
jgi:outer membrane lipoprotein-sorting protein